MVAVTLGRFPGFEASAASLKKDPTGLLWNMFCDGDGEEEEEEEEDEKKKSLTVEETELQRALGAKWSSSAAAMVASHYSYEEASKVISCPAGTWIGDLVDVADFFGLETLDPCKIFLGGSLGEQASAKLYLRRREVREKALAQIKDLLLRKPSMSVGFVSVACGENTGSALLLLRQKRSDAARGFELLGTEDAINVLKFGTYEGHWEWTNVLEEQAAFCEMLRRHGLASEWSSIVDSIRVGQSLESVKLPVLLVKVPRSGTRLPEPGIRDGFMEWVHENAMSIVLALLGLSFICFLFAVILNAKAEDDANREEARERRESMRKALEQPRKLWHWPRAPVSSPHAPRRPSRRPSRRRK